MSEKKKKRVLFSEKYTEDDEIRDSTRFKTELFDDVYRVEFLEYDTIFTKCGMKTGAVDRWKDDEILEIHEVAYLKLCGEIE